jgi:hypothetical protein
VYDWPAADGLRGGSPHLHTVSAEGYVVIGGEGTLQTLSGSGYGEHPLAPGTVLWFTPGTVHRLVTAGDGLDVLVVMQNSGLPEAGDAVLTFPMDVLADPAAYARAAGLPPGSPAPLACADGPALDGPALDDPAAAVGHAAVGDAARARRDLAVAGYLRLRDDVYDRGPGALEPLYRAAVELVGPRVERWQGLWRERALAQAKRTGQQLAALASGRADHLHGSAVFRASPTPPPAAFGMCGRLQTWDFTGS